MSITPKGSTILEIPPDTAADDLVRVINDRLRRVWRQGAGAQIAKSVPGPAGAAGPAGPAGSGGGAAGPPYPAFTAPPAAASFTNVQGGGSSIASDALGQLVVTAPGGGAVWYPFLVAVPPPPYSLTAGLRCAADFSSSAAGLCFSDGTHFTYFFDTVDLGIQYNSSVQGFGGTVVQHSGAGVRGAVCFLRLTDDGSSQRSYSLSVDGLNWTQIASESRTANYTPSKAGLVLLGSGSGIGSVLSCFHFLLA